MRVKGIGSSSTGVSDSTNTGPSTTSTSGGSLNMSSSPPPVLEASESWPCVSSVIDACVQSVLAKIICYSHFCFCACASVMINLPSPSAERSTCPFIDKSFFARFT